jgi:hypothetical protein
MDDREMVSCPVSNPRSPPTGSLGVVSLTADYYLTRKGALHFSQVLAGRALFPLHDIAA